MATKQTSTQAQAAKAIRRELKAAFPSVAFSVRSSSFAGGDAVDVSWSDGPTRLQVAGITGKYQEGDFDPSADLYEYGNARADLPQTKYVQTHRSYGRDAWKAAAAIVNRERGWSLAVRADANAISPDGDGWDDDNNCAQSDTAWRLLNDTPLLCGACPAATLPGDRYCPQCGAPLVPDAATDAAEADEACDHPAGSEHRWFVGDWECVGCTACGAVLKGSDAEWDAAQLCPHGIYKHVPCEACTVAAAVAVLSA